MNVLEERARTHGHFCDVARSAQVIKSEVDKADHLDITQIEALDMIATKIARILHGNSNEPDHWLDIEGYARLVRLELEDKT
tara:strand:+ start:225 stop:470 length:246 start_codon:yes stop_codon:yes gene_type:complete